jgi:hypothetical protein
VTRLDEVVGFASGAIATWIVWLRSAAEMPVVTPSRASIETVNGTERRFVVVGHRPQRQLVGAFLGQAGRRAARACVAMKLIVSGVANWAAIPGRPSFRGRDRRRPRRHAPRISSIASSIAANGVVTAIGEG